MLWLPVVISTHKQVRYRHVQLRFLARPPPNNNPPICNRTGRQTLRVVLLVRLLHKRRRRVSRPRDDGTGLHSRPPPHIQSSSWSPMITPNSTTTAIRIDVEPGPRL